MGSSIFPYFSPFFGSSQWSVFVKVPNNFIGKGSQSFSAVSWILRSWNSYPIYVFWLQVFQQSFWFSSLHAQSNYIGGIESTARNPNLHQMLQVYIVHTRIAHTCSSCTHPLDIKKMHFSSFDHMKLMRNTLVTRFSGKS